MIVNPILKRVELLLQQDRYKEAEEMVKNYLDDDPSSEYGRYLLAYILFYKGDARGAFQIAEQLREENPSNLAYLELMAEINIKEDEYEAADEKIEILINEDPEDTRYLSMQARSYFAQRRYDSALQYANLTLENDPEDLTALNLKSTISGILGHKEVALNTIEEALESDPENPYTIANHGQQLLAQGKVNEALERFSHALSLNPTNEYAQYGMQQGLKSKFFLYRLFMKYYGLMARLTANGSWAFVIGAYVCYRAILYLSKTMPFLLPLVYVIMAFFILSWVINPLMNLYLMTNKYGRHLLDNNEKTMAKLTGGALVLAIISFSIYFTLDLSFYLMYGIFFVAMMIPLGTFLLPYSCLLYTSPSPRD